MTIKGATQHLPGFLLLCSVFAGCASMNGSAHTLPESDHPDMTDAIADIRTSMNMDKAERSNGQKGSPHLYKLLECDRYDSVNGIAGLSPTALEHVAKNHLRLRYEKNKAPASSPGSAEYRRDLCGDFIALDILPHNGITKEEQDLQTAFIKGIKRDPAWIKYETRVFENAYTALSGDQTVQTALESWKPQKEYSSPDEALGQYRQKQAALQKTADEIRKAFGMESIPVYLVSLPGDVDVAGFFRPDKPSIIVNYNPDPGLTDDPRDAMQTVIEETLHSVDSDLIRMLDNDELPLDDPRRAHAALNKANQLYYIFPYETPDDSDVIARVKHMKRWDDYENQYAEYTAKLFSARFCDRLFRPADAMARAPSP